MQNAEHHREQFELAYATAWAKDRDSSETPEQLAAEVKTWRDGDTYETEFTRLRFGWEGYQWALAGRQCLAQIEEPAGAAPAAVAGPAWDKTRDSLSMLMMGFASNPSRSIQAACAVLDSATEPGMPLAYLRGAAPALEAPAAPAKHSPGAVYIAVSALEQERARGYRQGLAAAARRLAAAPQAPAAPVLSTDAARMDWLESRKYRDVRDGGYSAYYSIHLPAMAVGPWRKKNGGEFDYRTLREAIDSAIAAQAKEGGAA